MEHTSLNTSGPELHNSGLITQLSHGTLAAAPVETDQSHADSVSADDTTVTVCGRRFYVSFTRPYVVPADVDWGAKLLARRWAFLYEDPDVAAQFRAFFFRNLTSAATGVLYGSGAVIVAGLQLTVGIEELRIVSGLLAMVVMMADVAIHTTCPVTPFWGTVRHCLALAIILILAPTTTLNLFYVDTECDRARSVDTTALGRRDFSNVDVSSLCVLGMAPYSISAIVCGSVGLMLHPMAHGCVLVLLVSLTYLGRLIVPDEAEAARDLLPKILVSTVVAVTSFAISAFRCLGAMDAFEQTLRVETQRREAAGRAAQIGALLSTVVPEAVLPRLAGGGDAQFTVDTVGCATVLFADMKGFTEWSSARPAREVATMLNTIVGALDRLEQSVRGVNKVKTIGDAYWAVAGIPVEAEDHADQMVLFAHGMAAVVAHTAEHHPQWGALQWRIGIHSGPLSGALFGAQQVSYEVFGVTSKIAELVEARGVPGVVCVTSSTGDALLVLPEPSLLRHVCTFTYHDEEVEVLEISRVEVEGTDSIVPGISAQDIGLASVATIDTHSVGSRRNSHLGHTHGVAPMPRIPRTPSVTFSSAPGSPHSLSHGSGNERSAMYHNIVLEAEEEREADAGQRSSHEQKAAEFDAAAAAELSARRWRFLPWFRDAAAEARFKAQCETSTRGTHRAMALGCVAFACAVLLAGFVQTDPCWSPVGFSLHVVGIALAAAANGVAIHPTAPLALTAPLLTVGSVLCMIGTGVSSRSGCGLGHDVLFFDCVIVITLAFCVGPVSWPVLSLGVVCLTAPPAYVLAWLHSPGPLHTMIISPIMIGFSVAFSLMTEATLRWHFIEAELSGRAEAHLAALGEEREQLLRRLVPQHVVQDLVVWFGTGMDPAAAIVREYEEVVVGFVRLVAPPTLPALPSPSASLSTSLQHRTHDKSEVDAGSAAAWLPRAHAVVDEDIARIAAAQHRNDTMSCNSSATTFSAAGFPAAPSVAIDKVKTVGDVVILAGPFVDGFSTADAVDAAIAITTLLAGKTTVRVGLHVGPVVGTVQGVTRLAFDTFGDVVNVASRVMSSAEDGGVQCSVALVDVLSPDAHGVAPATSLCGALHFGPETAIAAKGKGEIGVHSLESFPALNL